MNPAWHVPRKPWAGKLAGKVIPGGTPENPLKSRWLGIYDGAGIHGTSERRLARPSAIHGCVRMRVEDVEALYPQVPVGAPIYIASCSPDRRRADLARGPGSPISSTWISSHPAPAAGCGAVGGERPACR